MSHHRKRRFNCARVLIILGIVLAMFNLLSQYWRYLDMQDKIAIYEQDLITAEQEYEQLMAKKELLSNNDSYMEQLARESLGMVRAGEAVVVPAEVSDIPELDTEMDEDEVLH